MNITAFFQSLEAALLARLSSIGAAVAAGFATIVMSFTSDQRTILLDVKQTFASKYAELKAATPPASEVNAIEGAATAAYNKFCSDEKAEFTQEAAATIVLLESSAKSAAGILGTVITGGLAQISATPTTP